MRILMISTDRRIFDEGSAVRNRMNQYGSLFEELHIVVFSMRKLQLKESRIADNVYAYPTNVLFKPFYLRKAFKIGKKILSEQGGGNWIITTQDPFETGLVGFRLKKKFKFPLQVQLHGDFTSLNFRRESAINRMRLAMSEKVLAQADCTRAVSKRIIHGVKEKYKLEKDPFLLPIVSDVNEIIPEELGLDIHDEYSQFNFISIVSSRLEKVKNIDLAIRAFAKSTQQNSKAGLIIIGDGTEKTNLKALVKKLNLEGSIIFKGWVDDRKKIISYYKSADLFINTSNHEGYCLSLVEAAAAGCPIITTNVGVVGEILTESSALICDVDDEECVAKNLSEAYKNPELLNKISNNARTDIMKNALTMNQYLVGYRDSFEKC